MCGAQGDSGDSPSNYKPTILTSVIEKLLEKNLKYSIYLYKDGRD